MVALQLLFCIQMHVYIASNLGPLSWLSQSISNRPAHTLQHVTHNHDADYYLTLHNAYDRTLKKQTIIFILF